GSMPPVTIYWSDTGDVYVPPGMTPDQARQIPGTGPTIANAAGVGGRAGRGAAAPAGPGGAPPDGAAQAGRAGRAAGRGAGGGQATQAGAPAAPPNIGYNQVFVGSKGYLGTSGRRGRRGLLPWGA